MKKIVWLIPFLCILTGCYNYRELNDLAIVSGISISKDKDVYKVTAEVINPKKQQDSSGAIEPDFLTYTSSGSSMQEALRNVIKESPRKLYAAQMNILIIDEETARHEINDILDFFSRDPEIRSEFYVLIGKGDEVLQVTTPLENISAKNIFDSLKANNTYLGLVNLVTYHDLINNYLNPNIEIALPSVQVVGDEKKGEDISNIGETESEAASVISNVMVFKGDKLLGELSDNESLAYNIVMNNIRTFLLKVPYSKGEFVVNEIIDYDTKIDSDIKKKKISINIKGEASISEVNANLDLESDKTIEKMQKRLNSEIEKLLKESINSTIEKYNSDIYGFRDLCYKSNPKEYKKIKDKWYTDIFKDLDIEVKSSIEIIEKGNLNGGLYHE